MAKAWAPLIKPRGSLLSWKGPGGQRRVQRGSDLEQDRGDQLCSLLSPACLTRQRGIMSGMEAGGWLWAVIMRGRGQKEGIESYTLVNEKLPPGVHRSSKLALVVTPPHSWQ